MNNTFTMNGIRMQELNYTRFNIERPEDFTGHSLSVSDVVVIRQNGQETAHYCDSFGFSEVPEFLEPENYLKNAEIAVEDDYGMVDGIINNSKKEVTPPGTDEKTSIRDRLAEAVAAAFSSNSS